MGAALFFPTSVPLALIIISWLAWRIWRFTLQPRLDKSSPRPIPYWVPWFGHMIAFFRDGGELVTRSRLRYAPNREPFNLVLGGQNVYIITSAKDASTVFRNVADLSFDAYVRDIILRFGASQAGFHAMWAKPSAEAVKRRGEEKGFPNPNRKPLIHVSEDIFKVQLHPGPDMEKLRANLVERICERMSWDSIPDSVIRHRDEKDCERVVSLRDWIEHFLLDVATRSFFGETILKIEPALLETFATFDNNSWKFTYQLPPALAKEVYESKAKLQTAFRKYAELPLEERSDACWMVKTLEAEMRAVGTGNDDISAYFLMLFWPIHGNPWKVTFWLIAHLLYKPDVKKRIEDEVNPLFAAQPPLTPMQLSKELDKCPVLTAAYHEALRWSSSTVMVRDVMHDCTVGNKLLRSSSRVLIPFRQMLLDASVFGAEPASFHPERFLQNPALAKDPSFRPFGGGLTYCPGRFVSQKEIFAVVALVLGRFHVELQDAKAAFPMADEKKPTLGTMVPVDGDDVLVKMRRR